jgi:bacterial microcompartment shell protein
MSGRGRSIGMIETWGYVAAVEALDAGMKAANVLSDGCEVTPSALVTISFSGDVSAVKTAVSAGIAAARKVGQVVAHHVIARPDEQLRSHPPVSAPSVAAPVKTVKIEQAPSSASRPRTKRVDPAPGPAQEVALPKPQASKATRGKKPKPKAPASKKRGKPSAAKPISSPKKTARRMPKKKPPGGDKKPGA